MLLLINTAESPVARPRRLWQLVALHIPILLVVAGAGSSAAIAQSSIDIQREYDVKGAYLYSFSRYVTWPKSAFPGPEAPLVIGVFGEAPLDRILQRIERTKTVQGRAIQTQRCTKLAECRRCHVLFVARSVSSEQQREAIRKLMSTGILLVGETPDFTEWGGVVNFYLHEDTVRFEINVEAAKRGGLMIDAKLLRIARAVGEP